MKRKGRSNNEGAVWLGSSFCDNMYTLTTVHARAHSPSVYLSSFSLFSFLLFVQGKDVEMAPTTSNDAPAKEAEFKPKKAPRKL